MSQPLLFVEQAKFITDTLTLLNENKTSDDNYYLHVELRMAGDPGVGDVVGTFSDEIASDCWSFEFTETP